MTARNYDKGFGLYQIVGSLEEVEASVEASVQSGEPVELQVVPAYASSESDPKTLGINFLDVLTVPDDNGNAQRIALGWLGSGAVRVTVGHDGTNVIDEPVMVNLTEQPAWLVRAAAEAQPSA